MSLSFRYSTFARIRAIFSVVRLLVWLFSCLLLPLYLGLNADTPISPKSYLAVRRPRKKVDDLVEPGDEAGIGGVLYAHDSLSLGLCRDSKRRFSEL